MTHRAVPSPWKKHTSYFCYTDGPSRCLLEGLSAPTLQPQNPGAPSASASDSSVRMGPQPWPGSSHLTSASSCSWVPAPCTQQLQDCAQGRVFLQRHSKLRAKLSVSISRLVSLLSTLATSLSAALENLFDSTIIQKITFLFSHNSVVISLLLTCNGILCLCGTLNI